MRILGTDRMSANTPLYFQGKIPGLGTIQKCTAIPHSNPLLTPNVFQGPRCVNRKRKLQSRQELWSTTLFVSPLCHHAGARILTRFLFALCSQAALQCRSMALKTGLPIAKHNCDGTLVLFKDEESHLISCYSRQDLHNETLHTTSQQCFKAFRSPCYSFAHTTRTNGPVSADRLKAIHFRYHQIRLVSCYTLLSCCRLP